MHDSQPTPGEVERNPAPAPDGSSPPEITTDDEGYAVIGAGIDFTDPNSPLAPFYMQVSHVLLVAFLALVFAAVSLAVPVWHTDVWAHLRFGEEIVRNRALPAHEPFPESFADHEAPYIHYQWVAQAGGYLVYTLGERLAGPEADARLGGGATMLETAHALIIVLRLLLLFIAFRRLSGSPSSALVGVILVTLMGTFVHLAILRPQVLGELALAAVMVPLSRPSVSRRALVLVPLVFLVWANCHSTFVMGFIFIGAVLAGRLVEAARSTPGSVRAALHAAWTDTEGRRLALLLTLSVAATFVNPHGPTLLLRSWALAKNPNIAFMEEWKPIPLNSAVHVVFLGSVLLLAVLLRLSPARVTPTQLLLLLFFGLESVLHARFVVWWCMLYVWCILPHLDAVLRGRLPAWLRDESIPSFRKTAAALLVAGSLFMWSAPAMWGAHGKVPSGRQRVTSATPVQAVELLRERHAADPGQVRAVFASETLGDYLLWGLRGLDPPIRVVCYTHVHLFTPEHWNDCFAVKRGDPDWPQRLDSWQVDFIVLEYELYDQEGHRAQGEKPGMFPLIDRVKAARRADGRPAWKVHSEKPVFIAERVRP